MMQSKNRIQFYLHVYKKQIQVSYMSETYGMIFLFVLIVKVFHYMV